MRTGVVGPTHGDIAPTAPASRRRRVKRAASVNPKFTSSSHARRTLVPSVQLKWENVISRNTKIGAFFVTLIAAAAVLITVIAVTGRNHSAVATGTGVDLTFARDMVPHHQDAVSMARIARGKTKRPQIASLADAIIATQSQEITELQAIDRRLTAAGTQPAEPLGGGEHAGMSMNDPGMGGTQRTMSEMDLEALRTSGNFDRDFIDAMIPHHQSAILMARAVLERGSDEEVRALASAVIDAQSREIIQMNEWRKAWYGSESPAGSVPT